MLTAARLDSCRLKTNDYSDVPGVRLAIDNGQKTTVNRFKNLEVNYEDEIMQGV